MSDKNWTDLEKLAYSAACVLMNVATTHLRTSDFQIEDCRCLKGHLARVAELTDDPDLKSDIGHAILTFNERFPAIRVKQGR